MAEGQQGSTLGNKGKGKDGQDKGVPAEKEPQYLTAVLDSCRICFDLPPRNIKTRYFCPFATAGLDKVSGSEGSFEYRNKIRDSHLLNINWLREPAIQEIWHWRECPQCNVRLGPVEIRSKVFVNAHPRDKLDHIRECLGRITPKPKLLVTLEAAPEHDQCLRVPVYLEWQPKLLTLQNTQTGQPNPAIDANTSTLITSLGGWESDSMEVDADTDAEEFTGINRDGRSRDAYQELNLTMERENEGRTSDQQPEPFQPVHSEQAPSSDVHSYPNNAIVVDPVAEFWGEFVNHDETYYQEDSFFGGYFASPPHGPTRISDQVSAYLAAHEAVSDTLDVLEATPLSPSGAPLPHNGQSDSQHLDDSQPPAQAVVRAAQSDPHGIGISNLQQLGRSTTTEAPLPASQHIPRSPRGDVAIGAAETSDLLHPVHHGSDEVITTDGQSVRNAGIQSEVTGITRVNQRTQEAPFGRGPDAWMGRIGAANVEHSGKNPRLLPARRRRRFRAKSEGLSSGNSSGASESGGADSGSVNLAGERSSSSFPYVSAAGPRIAAHRSWSAKNLLVLAADPIGTPNVEFAGAFDFTEALRQNFQFGSADGSVQNHIRRSFGSDLLATKIHDNKSPTYDHGAATSNAFIFLNMACGLDRNAWATNYIRRAIYENVDLWRDPWEEYEQGLRSFFGLGESAPGDDLELIPMCLMRKARDFKAFAKLRPPAGRYEVSFLTNHISTGPPSMHVPTLAIWGSPDLQTVKERVNPLDYEPNRRKPDSFPFQSELERNLPKYLPCPTLMRYKVWIGDKEPPVWISIDSSNLWAETRPLWVSRLWEDHSKSAWREVVVAEELVVEGDQDVTLGIARFISDWAGGWILGGARLRWLGDLPSAPTAT